ncbi:MAG: chromate efflux transporter [Bauldia sp.]
MSAGPTFREATAVWAKIGLLGFGGPAGQIALMHRMVVEERKWVSEARFLHALNFCMLLPGPEAQQLATYIGWLLHGTRGGIVAGTLFILPGLALILGLSTLYAVFNDAAWLASLFFGLKAAVLAIVIDAVVRIGRRALKGGVAVSLAALAFVGIFAFHVPFPVIVLGAGLIGVAVPRFFFLADVDDTEADAVAPPTAARSLRVVAVWGALWAAPVIIVGVGFGWGSLYAGLGGFFSQMAVVTFGGAYAVLAYVGQVAVSSYHWLQPGQMLDGLALAETTPGPLLLVLTFIGFIAAYAAPGVLPPLAGGFLGALLVTWVTFVPSFLWIFLGAPYIERVRGNRTVAAGLAAITAAVVGVILNLAVFLALHVLFWQVGELAWGLFRPAWPLFSSLDPEALALAVIAAVALFRLRLGILPILGVCGVLGLLIRLI